MYYLQSNANSSTTAQTSTPPKTSKAEPSVLDLWWILPIIALVSLVSYWMRGKKEESREAPPNPADKVDSSRATTQYAEPTSASNAPASLLEQDPVTTVDDSKRRSKSPIVVAPEAKEKPKKIRYKKNKANQVKRDSEFADAATSIRSGAELEDTVEYKPRLSTPRELASTASLESLSDSEPESSIVASEPSVLEFEPLKNAPPLRHLTSPKTPKEAKPPKKESVDRNAIVRINKNLPRFAELRTVELPEDLKQVASTVSSRWSLDRDAGQTNTLVGKQNENASLTETELPAVHLQRHDRTESQESNDRPRGGLAAIVAKKLASKTDPKP